MNTFPDIIDKKYIADTFQKQLSVDTASTYGAYNLIELSIYDETAGMLFRTSPTKEGSYVELKVVLCGYALDCNCAQVYVKLRCATADSKFPYADIVSTNHVLDYSSLIGKAAEKTISTILSAIRQAEDLSASYWNN